MESKPFPWSLLLLLPLPLLLLTLFCGTETHVQVLERDWLADPSAHQEGSTQEASTGLVVGPVESAPGARLQVKPQGSDPQAAEAVQVQGGQSIRGVVLDPNALPAPIVDVDPGQYQLKLTGSCLAPTCFPLEPQSQIIHIGTGGSISAQFPLALMANFEIPVDVPLPAAENVTIHKRIRDGQGRLLMERETGRDGSYEVEEDEYADEEYWSSDVDSRRSQCAAAAEPKPMAPPPPGSWGWLPAGTYTLEVQASGYEPWSQTIQLNPGVRSTIPVALKHMPKDKGKD